jgi:bifunctional N-acetylglutamate synthase/kinase
MNDLRPTIIKLLSNIGSHKEIQLYLKRFSQLDAKRFAVVKVGGAILRDRTEELIHSLAFLQQIGLTPVVVHGAGPQLDAAMQEKGIEKKTIDGLRVTTPEVLSVVRRVLLGENARLVEALQAQGVRATAVSSGVFECALLDQSKYGFVGDVQSVHTEVIDSAIQAQSIPVIASLGETAEGQIVNINADWAANDLIKSLQPYKIIFLTETGGLLDGNGQLIEAVNLQTDYAHLLEQPWLHSGMRVKIEQIHDLLQHLPLSSSVSITKPSELAKELFTHRGSGTLLRRGEAFHCFTDWKDVDTAKLRVLIESAFGRSLSADYFETTRLYRAYVSEHYRAALILTEEEGITHLDKFAVDAEAQGEGLGKAAWQMMREENPQLFWRSRVANRAVNSFYFDEADGCQKNEEWIVFWYGLQSLEQIQFAIEHCRSRPATLRSVA